MLVDSEPIASRILSRLLSDEGYATTPERCHADFQGNSFDAVLRIVAGRLGRPLRADFFAHYQRTLFEAFRDELAPVAGVREVLDELTIPYCVASNASRDKIRYSLELTGLLPYFGEHIFSSHQVESGKPAPDLFLLAARTLGVPPERCCVIEDSSLGIEAANRAGMTSFGFAGRTRRDLLSGATGGIFESMDELPDLLR